MNNVPKNAPAKGPAALEKAAAPAGAKAKGVPDDLDWSPEKKAKKEASARSSRSPSTHERGSSSMLKKRGLFGRIVFYIIVVALVSVVLPRLEYFTHDIEITDDRNSYGMDYIMPGDESADVTAMQVKLYSLDYLEIDQITGRFDSETLNALNTALEDNGAEAGSSCSYENYSLIMGLGSSDETDEQQDGGEATEQTTPPEPEQTQPAPQETEPTTAATTADPNLTMKVCITAESTKLRNSPSQSGTPLYLLLNGATYMGLNEAQDDEGVTWYRIKYSAGQFGWVVSTDVNVYYE